MNSGGRVLGPGSQFSWSQAGTINVPPTPLFSCCRISVYTEKWSSVGFLACLLASPDPLRLCFADGLPMPQLICSQELQDRGAQGGPCSCHGKTLDTVKSFISKKTHLWSKHNSVEKSHQICRKLVYI